VKEINLENNKLGDDCFKKLIKSLEDNHTISILNLSDNNLSDISAI
jgi:hypothetical protein